MSITVATPPSPPWFEDLPVGTAFAAAPALTLTEGHAALHQAIAGDRLRLALDHTLGEAVLGAGPALAHPALVWDVAIGQSTVATGRVIANLFYRGLLLRRPVRLLALIETAAGLAAAAEIARASPRLDGLVLGYADLAASLGRAGGAPGDWRFAQHAVLVAARAAGIQAIDGPYLGTRDDDAFRAGVLHARTLGFDGKWAIHPAQLDALREAFTPTEAEVADARETLAALERAAAEGAGAVAADGQMLDEALALSARRVLARAGAGR